MATEAVIKRVGARAQRLTEWPFADMRRDGNDLRAVLDERDLLLDIAIAASALLIQINTDELLEVADSEAGGDLLGMLEGAVERWHQLKEGEDGSTDRPDAGPGAGSPG